MGLLDNNKKTAASIKDQVEQSGVADKVRAAADDIRNTAPPPPPSTSAQVSGGGDLSDPVRWMAPADMTAITGVPVGPGTPVRTAETFGVAFTGTDARGSFRFEVHSVDEDVIGRYGGRPDAWIDERAAAHERHSPVSTFGDYTVVAADGDSHFWFFAWVADSCFSAEAHTPGIDMTRACEGILRHVYDWPEE